MNRAVVADVCDVHAACACAAMPGGYLSFGIYQRLGGEREFGAFWLQLGLPTIVACAACWLPVAQRLMSPKAWVLCSVGLIGALALAVSARLIS